MTVLRPMRHALLFSLCALGPVTLAAQPAPVASPLVGRLVPTFAWPAMHDSATIISPVSLDGSVVLIDLWATWCGPCVVEMPFLHEAWTRFRARGLAIVSVAFDRDPARVDAFRKERFPMPWQHVFATPQMGNDAVRMFGADQFPRTVLIDRDGTVLRADDGLRGGALLATLDSALAGTLSRTGHAPR